jgi:hypothetical protein
LANDLVAALLWAVPVTSLVLTVAGLATRSWERLFAAAVLSLVVSLVSFGLGLLVLLLTYLQVAAVLALRWSMGARGWAALLLLAVLAWLFLVALPTGVAGPWLVVLGFALPVLGITCAAGGRQSVPRPPRKA